MRLPSPVPELPVRSVEASGAFYQQKMGFRVDWVHADDLAGISRDAARISFGDEQNTKRARTIAYSSG
jgi:catechol 2,3-dioxygenase-like lactoylglutathione lyase family enzyme